MRKKIGMLFQSGALFNNMNVFENVAFPIREHTNLDNDMINDLVLIITFLMFIIVKLHLFITNW